MTSSQFDQAATGWDEDPAKVRLAEAVAEAMILHLGLEGAGTVLDYGAGTGLVSFRLLPHVERVISADSSGAMLAVLRRKMEQAGKGAIEPVEWSVDQQWPLRERPTMVAASMVLHHIKDTSQAARAFYSLLLPGGQLAVADLDLEDGSFHGSQMHTEHNGFSRDTLRALFEEAGFASVRFHEAGVVTKPGPDGQPAEYPVFLMTARKP